MKKVNGRRLKIEILVFTILALFSSSMLIEQIIKTSKSFEIKKPTYKFYLEQHEGEHDYEPSKEMVFPTKGYALNIEKTNLECPYGTVEFNEDRSVNYTAKFATLCNLYYDIKGDNKYVLEKLQKLSGKWELKSGEPTLSKVSPKVTYTDHGLSSTTDTFHLTSNNYITYANSYTFDKNTGKYKLTSPTNCRVSSTLCRKAFESNKYVGSLEGSSSSGNNNYEDLDEIYQITDTDGTWTGAITGYYATFKTSSKTMNEDCSECGIWKKEDDTGLSYYVRGKYDYNYVSFANKFWRIIRINGDGSLRLFYDGENPNAKEVIETGKFNNSANSNSYVGYMYGNPSATTYDEIHNNTSDSNIKTKLDLWYQNNLLDFSNQIADSTFCNNRKVLSGDGIGTNDTTYDFDSDTYPLACPQKNDIFTVSNEVGNGRLTYPIGTISGEEVVRGGFYEGQTVGENNYLNKNKDYYTMSPKSFHSTTSIAYNLRVINTRTLGGLHVASTNGSGFVPVVNITSDAALSMTGSGTSYDPFVVGNSEVPKGTSTLRKLQALNSNIVANTTKPNFSQIATTDEGIRIAQDDYGTSYYWRGAATTNYVKFGDWYWRAIRINGDGSLRLFFAGDSPNAEGSIGEAIYNNNINNNAYVGYMYGNTSSTNYSEVHANRTNSAIKTTIENWYASNIRGKAFEKYLSDTLFCNDRSIYIGSGTGTSNTTYMPLYRIKNTKNPSLLCKQKNDRFTVSDTTIGNGDLTYPIGLLTSDELAMSGMVFETYNSPCFLQRDGGYYLMSPGEYDLTTMVIGATGNGPKIMVPNKSGGDAVPVINITPEAIDTMTGSGTASDPFIVH